MNKNVIFYILHHGVKTIQSLTHKKKRKTKSCVSPLAAIRILKYYSLITIIKNILAILLNISIG